MSKKPSNMKRKFSLDIPLLKIGPPKADARGSREQSASAHDSPPMTPKSVRPPLSPKVDHELRLACAYILQDFKPSHQLYEEHYGKGKDAKPRAQRVEPPVVDRNVNKDSVGPVEPLIISKRKPAAQPKEWSIGTSIINDITSDESDMRPSIKSQHFFEGLHVETNTLDTIPSPSKAEIVLEEDDDAITTDLSNLEPPPINQPAESRAAAQSRAFFDGVDLKKLRQQRAAAMQKFEQPKPPVIPKVGKAKSAGIQKALEMFGEPRAAQQVRPEPLEIGTAATENVSPEPIEIHARDLRPVDVDQIRLAPVEVKPLEIVPAKSGLRRSVSNPLHTRKPSHGRSHSRRIQGSDSAHTSASTPRTDTSQYHWTSTAPTSAVMTPAKNSARGSAQNFNVGFEKFRTEDIEWMREELDRHRKAQEESRAQQELENQVLASLGLETTPVEAHPTTPILQMAIRKQLAEANVDQGYGDYVTDEQSPIPVSLPRLSGPHTATRSESRRRRSTPRSESRYELEMLHPTRNSQVEPDQPSPLSVQSEIEYYLNESTADFDEPEVYSPTEASEMSRTSSRSRRMFQMNGDNGTRAPMASLQQSLQSSKRESRSRSVDSIRSTVSSLAPSIESVSKKMHNWRPFHRNQESPANEDLSRPSTAQEKRHTRDFSREISSPEPRKAKSPPINLNRELPPLPSLDQWKPVEPSKPKHIASLASPKRDSFRTSDPASLVSTAVEDTFHDDSPQLESPTVSSTHVQSLSSRYSKPTSDATDDDIPPYDPNRPPTLGPEIIKPAMDSGLAISNVADLLPETFSSLKAPEKPREQQRVPSEYMFRADFAPPVTIPASPPPMPKKVEEVKLIKRRTEDMFRADFTPPVTIPVSPPPIPKDIQAQVKKEEVKPSKRKTEDMFRADFQPPVTVPASPPPIPKEVKDDTKPSKRKTEDMFLPDLDARARRAPSNPNDQSASKKAPTKDVPAAVPARTTSKLTKDPVNYSRGVRRAATTNHGRGPSEPVMISEPVSREVAAAHARGPSEQINFSRKPSADNYSKLYDMGYRNLIPIQPTRSNTLGSPSPVVPGIKDKSTKKWYKIGSVKKKERGWEGGQAGLIDPATSTSAVPF